MRTVKCHLPKGWWDQLFADRAASAAPRDPPAKPPKKRDGRRHNRLIAWRCRAHN